MQQRTWGTIFLPSAPTIPGDFPIFGSSDLKALCFFLFSAMLGRQVGDTTEGFKAAAMGIFYQKSLSNCSFWDQNVLERCHFLVCSHTHNLVLYIYTWYNVYIYIYIYILTRVIFFGGLISKCERWTVPPLQAMAAESEAREQAGFSSTVAIGIFSMFRRFFLQKMRHITKRIGNFPKCFKQSDFHGQRWHLWRRITRFIGVLLTWFLVRLLWRRACH